MAILCIDVGGTGIKHGIIDEKLNISEKGVYHPDGSSLENYIESLGQLYDRYSDQVEGLACSMPGIIDPISGYFYSGGAYDAIIHEVPFKEMLEKRIPVRITIENDAKAAAYAELGYGVLKDIDDAILVTLGSAVGGCLIYQHKVVYGKHFSAGELSFVNTNYEKVDFRHSFGGRNGANDLARRVSEYLDTDVHYSGYDIFRMIDEGNEKVRAALHEFCMELCVQLYNLNIIFDPEVIAIGGGISKQPALYEEIEKCFAEMKATMRFFVRKPEVVSCAFGNDANIIGAYHRYMLGIEGE